MRMKLVLVCGVLFGASCQVSDLGIGNQATEIAANVLVVEPGLFSATNGSAIVDVVEESPEEVAVLFRDPSGEESCGMKFKLSNTPDNHWFMCWDQQNQWWVYKPHDVSPAVYLLKHADGAISMTSWDRVSASDGVPSAFMERLPESMREAS